MFSRCERIDRFCTQTAVWFYAGNRQYIRAGGGKPINIHQHQNPSKIWIIDGDELGGYYPMWGDTAFIYVLPSSYNKNKKQTASLRRLKRIALDLHIAKIKMEVGTHHCERPRWATKGPASIILAKITCLPNMVCPCSFIPRHGLWCMQPSLTFMHPNLMIKKQFDTESSLIWSQTVSKLFGFLGLK